MERHQLGMASEALALAVLESFHRTNRGIRIDMNVTAAALDNVMKDSGERFIPNRENLRRLNDLALQIVSNQTPPEPNTWLVKKLLEAA